VFPMIGSALTLLFRPSERDPYTYTPLKPPRVSRYTLALPSGEAVRFLGIPDLSGGVAFYLSESEIPDRIWRTDSQTVMTFDEALSFCDTLSRTTGRSIRLPTLAEWQLAARGGIPNAETTWGFGLHTLPKGLHFALGAPPSRPGPAFGYGFRDLAGGRWEWTAEGRLVGGAWSEQNPEVLRIDHVWRPPEGYGDQDTGIRILLEP